MDLSRYPEERFNSPDGSPGMEIMRGSRGDTVKAPAPKAIMLCKW
jgi:hypothetical protein